MLNVALPDVPDTAIEEGIRVMEVVTASSPFPEHDNAPSPVQTAIAGADRQYLVFSMEAGDVVFAEKGSFHSATVKPVLNVSLIGARRRGWIADLPLAIRWLPSLLTAPFRLFAGFVGRTAAGESALMLTVRATQPGMATFVNHSGGQIQRIPITNETSLTSRRGAWVAHSGDISIGVGTMRAPLAALTSGAAFWYERATGDGDVFIAAGGHIVRRVLSDGERIVIKPVHLLAWLDSPRFSAAGVGSVGAAVWANEGLVLLAVDGPSVLYLDTAPRLARRHAIPPDAHYTGRAD